MDRDRLFATPDELRRMYPSIDETFGDKRDDDLKAMLTSVSAAIAALCDADEIDASILRLVTCQATARVLQASCDGTIGASQHSWSASPYSETVAYYKNPSGDLYLTAFEKRLLGIDEGFACYINQKVG